ncbi:cytochrome P450 [Tanacetum coccineum]
MEGEGFLAVIGSWKGKSGLVGFINVYAPQDVNLKIEIWKKIANIINSIDAAWCIFGDFNEVRNESERRNSNFDKRGADVFNDFILGENLIDMPLGGKRFTRISDDGLKFSKLDRFLINQKFGSEWNSLSVVAMERKLSDHCPLVIYDKVVDFGPKSF